MSHPLLRLFLLVAARVAVLLVLVVCIFSQLNWIDFQFDSRLGRVRVITFSESIQATYWSPSGRGRAPRSFCRVCEYPHDYVTNRNFSTEYSQPYSVLGAFLRIKDGTAGPNHWFALTSATHTNLILAALALYWCLERSTRTRGDDSKGLHSRITNQDWSWCRILRTALLRPIRRWSASCCNVSCDESS